MYRMRYNFAIETQKSASAMAWFTQVTLSSIARRCIFVKWQDIAVMIARSALWRSATHQYFKTKRTIAPAKPSDCRRQGASEHCLARAR